MKRVGMVEISSENHETDLNLSSDPGFLSNPKSGGVLSSQRPLAVNVQELSVVVQPDSHLWIKLRSCGAGTLARLPVVPQNHARSTQASHLRIKQARVQKNPAVPTWKMMKGKRVDCSTIV
jgi:hypothetical protein